MKRLTINKEVSEMNMVELAHNSCFAKDQNATYRDFESEIDARDFTRKIGVTFGIFENGCAELMDDESFDATMVDYLQYGYDTKEGLLALFYRNLWAQANLYERLKHYEDLEKQSLLLKLPCKVGDTVYVIEVEEEKSKHFHYGIKLLIKVSKHEFNFWMIPIFGKFVFLTETEAKEAAKRMERGE